MLLGHNHSAGAKSFKDIRTVNGEIYLTFQEACSELGLPQNDQEWEIVLRDSAHTHMCPQLRQLFISILLFCDVSNSLRLFSSFSTLRY